MLILVGNTVDNISNTVSQAVSDFFVGILVYLYYYAGKIFPVAAGIVIAVSVIILSTIYGAKNIRRKALFALLVIPFLLFLIYYGLAIFLSFRSAS